MLLFFFFSSRRRHTRYIGDWSSDVCSSDLRIRILSRKLRGTLMLRRGCRRFRFARKPTNRHLFSRRKRYRRPARRPSDRKSTRLNSSHRCISYAVFCLKKKKKKKRTTKSKT